MIEGRFGNSKNLQQRIQKALHIQQAGRPLADYLKEIEGYVYSFRDRVPGVVCAALALEGMDPYYKEKLQSNPSNPEGIYTTYRELRNRASGLAQYDDVGRGPVPMDLDKSKDKVGFQYGNSRDWEVVNKKRVAQFVQPHPKKPNSPPHNGGASGSGTKEANPLQCRRCGKMGHASAASPKCPEHNPNFVKNSTSAGKRPMQRP